MSGNLLVFSRRALQAVHSLEIKKDTQRISADLNGLWRLGGKKPSMRDMRQEIELSLGSEKLFLLKSPLRENQGQQSAPQENISGHQKPLQNSPAPLLWLKKMMQTLPKCVVDPSASRGNKKESEVPRSRYKVH